MFLGLIRRLALLVLSPALFTHAHPPAVDGSDPHKAELAPASQLAGNKSKLSALAKKPDWKQLEALSGVVGREEFEAAMTNIYSDESSAARPWKIEGDKVLIETTPGQAPAVIAFRNPHAEDVPLTHYWHSVRELAPLKPGEPPLTGLHIALDPGHIGGGYSKMEERWLSMKSGEAVVEGSLVLKVAQVLQPRLEALGARVSLVRSSEAPVTTAKPDDYKDAAREVLADAGILNPKETYGGVEGDPKIITVQWQAEKLFYRVSEIRARARRVNEELRPDMVFCLHLNAEAWGDAGRPAFVLHNHFHLLINGCYAPDEMQFDDVRFEMFRRLFHRVHEEERRMADVIAPAMATATGLPPYLYMTKNARRVSASPYVYARNLLANRLYQCPVIYLEPYVMNHEETYKRLLLGHFVGRTLMDGHLVSSPLEDYARGVVNGIVDYCKRERRAAP